MNKLADDSKPSSVLLKTSGGKTNSNAIEIPSIALPKGGGAIRGIDEKFIVNAVNGTASFAVALPFSSARGHSPDLSLTYNSGGGNSPFGIGWSLTLPSVKRKTDRELPRYIDEIDSDTFLFSEAEDLVPEFKKEADGSFSKDSDGNYIINEKISPDGLYTIRFYRPRIEGWFARIERWSSKTSQEIKWRVISKANVTTLFGWSEASKISDPKNSDRVFEWLPEFSFDDKGNCIHYLYKKEDDSGFDSSLLNNRNRMENGTITYTNLYLEKILYGNKVPYKSFNDPFPAEASYFFQTVFDYGEYNTIAPYDKINAWDFRKDAFSDYHASFEIRTTRLCKRVLLFHFFTELPGGSALVRSLTFEYDTSSDKDFTFLKSIISSGYIKKTDGTYTLKSLPATEYEYQKHEWSKEVKTISSENLVHAPAGLDEPRYQFVDLFNEGLSGILTEQSEGWYYKHNLGEGKFEQAKLVSPKPSFSGLGSAMQLADLDADGGKQFVSLNTEPKGYFELSDSWQPFRIFENLPNIDFQDANSRMIDLNGDGKPEILITEDHVFTWYESDGRKGFSAAHKSVKSLDEEEGPHVVFSDQVQSVFLADMSGDGLIDIVRIRNGAICYWPNLGHGKFGKKVNMDHAPFFDHPDAFNPEYLQLADIDGSGTSDIIYLGKNKFSCWMNLSGNSFSIDSFEIENFPSISNESNVTVVDLLGNGMPCIVWSGNFPEEAHAPLRYIDLMNSKKPHILIRYKNNIGKEVYLEYTASTKFYIEDKLAGKPWVTKLHFPVHCISKTETIDKISGYRFVSSYKYHHGYFDHAEREFRGFGMVEQKDSEHFEHWVKGGAGNMVEQDLHQEPVLTKSWFHTGAFLLNEKILGQFALEYWYEEMFRQGFPVPNHEVDLQEARLETAPGLDPSLINHLSQQEWREAFRSCKGLPLRTEVFAQDAPLLNPTDDQIRKALTPFSVATHNCLIELLQPKGQNKFAVYVVKESEAITYSYERNTEDPRVAHLINVKLDEYGNVEEAASIVYPRRITDASLPLETQEAQNKTTILYTQSRFTNDINEENNYREREASEGKIYELKGVLKSGAYYRVSDFENILNVSGEVAYHETDLEPAPGVSQKRLLEHTRTVFYKNDLTDVLPLHTLQSKAFSFENYQLAYTPALVTFIFGTKVNDALMTEGKFTHHEGDNNWWIRSGTPKFIEGTETAVDAQNRFYLPISYTDPYGAKSRVSYYSDYFFLIEEARDELDNTSTVMQFDFRGLSPLRMKDSNNNISEVITDELGFVKAMAMLGKGNEADDLTGLTEFTSAAETTLINNFFNASSSDQLTSLAKDLLQHASARFVYDFDVYITSGGEKPVVVASISREEHFQVNNNSAVQLAFEYSNGLGHIVMEKAQAEPGLAKMVFINPDNTYTVSEINTSLLVPKQLRWIGNGRSILNNKGSVVKQYESYFSVTHQFEDVKELVETGVTPILHYDAMGRMIKTEVPDGTLIRLEFDSWMRKNYDQNDTILESSWFHNRTNHLIDAELIAAGKDPDKEKVAADKAAKHANTPSTQHFDSMGRHVLSVDHNKNVDTEADEFYHTFMSLDIEGNLRKATDRRGNIVEQHQYNMLGNKVYQHSMDTGQRWLLSNILDQPLKTWDERGHEFQYFYDILHRPVQSKVLGGDGDSPLDHVFDRIFYGEAESNPELKNVRGKIVKRYDTGGLTETPEFDFKGNPKSSTKRLFSNYKGIANWIDANLLNDLETESFTFTHETDALGRITKQSNPDGSIITPFYNEAGLLNGESVEHNDPAITTIYIKDIDYNEKGQRNKIIYGNDVITKFYYDKETFRLHRVESKRQNNDPLQDLYYTFDPCGNITHTEDKNIPLFFFNNQKTTGVSSYTYDALYRLTEATGRENNAALNFNDKDNWNDAPYMHPMNSGDPMLVRNYIQNYRYDAVGNILQMKHRSSGNDWTRNYDYQTSNNRLIRTRLGQVVTNFNYEYEHHTPHGFITTMPHLQQIDWNFKEEIVKTIRQKRIDGGTAETTYYQYDGEGKRVRKITENQADPGITPSRKEERIYIGGYELYKKHSGAHSGLKRVSLNLMDDTHRFVIIETRNDIDDNSEKHLVRYQLDNHLGSASLELDAIGEVISYEEYHPYGTTAFQANNASIKAAAKRYRYTGMERDEETGLSYHGARYYLSWLGRWISADPIGVVGGLNVYAYADSNPILLIDDGGTKPKKPRKPSKPKSQERKHGEKQQKAFREQHGMTGADVQAGHLATVRDAKKSGITPQHWDQAPMQQLHSRKGKGLDVDVTNPDGTKVTRTRHTAQEGMSDLLTERSEKIHGSLTPDAQIENANQQRWATENTPYDQRDVEKLRQSGAAKPSSVDADIDPKTGQVVEGPNTTAARERAAAKKATPKAPAPKVKPPKSIVKKVAKPLVKSIPLIGSGLDAADIVDQCAANPSALGCADAIVSAIPVIGDAYTLVKLGADLLKPDKMSAPALRADQSWAKPWIEGGTKSGCGTCHEAVRVDNWYKTSSEGSMWQQLNGPASFGGIPTDQAMQNYLKNGSW